MIISLIQCHIEWMQQERNRAIAEEHIAKCIGSDLIVLPEMFTTGFCVDPKGQAERELEGETTSWMAEMARLSKAAIAGSVMVEHEGRYYNRLYLVKPCGQVTKYDKRHLFSFANEEAHYESGTERVIIEIEGVKILPLICYDLRFGVWSRNRYLPNNATIGEWDVMICVANWPAARREAWDILLRARAVENLGYVCGVNIVGSTNNIDYSGGTQAIDFMGKELAKVEDYREGIATVEIDLERLKRFREHFPALRDSDDFEIKLQ